MQTTPHRIRSQRWQVRAGTEKEAFAWRMLLCDKAQELIFPVIEKAFDEAADSAPVIFIPRIELKVKMDSEGTALKELPEQIYRQLREKLRATPRECELIDSRQPPAKPITTPINRLDNLLHYLHTGTMPWYIINASASGTAIDVSEACRELLPLLLDYLQSNREDEAFYFRLLSLVDKVELTALISVIANLAPQSLRSAIEHCIMLLFETAGHKVNLHTRLRFAALILYGVTMDLSRTDNLNPKQLLSKIEAQVSPTELRVLYDFIFSLPEPASLLFRLNGPNGSNSAKSASDAAAPEDNKKLEYLRFQFNSDDSHESASDATRNDPEAITRALSPITNPVPVAPRLPGRSAEGGEAEVVSINTATAAGQKTKSSHLQSDTVDNCESTSNDSDYDTEAIIREAPPLTDPAQAAARVPGNMGKGGKVNEVSAAVSTADHNHSRVHFGFRINGDNDNAPSRIDPAILPNAMDDTASQLSLAMARLADKSLERSGVREGMSDATSRAFKDILQFQRPSNTPKLENDASVIGPGALHGENPHERYIPDLEHTYRRALSENMYPLMVSQGGLPLLHPYIPRFFSNTRVIPEGTKGIPSFTFARAAGLLHYLATGRAEIYEYELGLIKVLLGLTPETPLLVCEGVITAEDKRECEALLVSVIKHWGALKNTSADGLRTSFLTRPALMREKDNSWRLKVERRSYDILLDQLPWGVSLVKLPWMKQPLFTEW